MLKRSFSLFLALTLLALGSFLVAGAEQTVTFWTTDNESERVAAYEKVAEQFMEENPEVEVEIVPIEEADIGQKLSAARAANNLPDIMRGGVERVFAFSAQDLINEEMTQEVINSIGKDEFRAGTLEKVTNPATGNYAAVPYDGWVNGVWYREDMFKKHNLTPPRSWADLNAAVDKLSAAENPRYALVLGTDPGQNYGHQEFEQVAISNGAWPFDENGNVTMDSPEMVEALDFYTSLQRGAVPGPQYWRKARSAYQTGQTAIALYSTYIMGDLLQSSERVSVDNLVEKTGLVTETVGPEGAATYGQLATLLIFKEADPATARVVEYFLQEGYKDILKLAPFGKLPVLEEAASDWKDLSPVFDKYPDETLNTLLDGFENMQRWVFRPDYGAMERSVIGNIEGRLLIPKVLSKIAIEKSMTPEEGAEWLQKRVENMVEESQ